MPAALNDMASVWQFAVVRRSETTTSAAARRASAGMPRSSSLTKIVDCGAAGAAGGGALAARCVTPLRGQSSPPSMAVRGPPPSGAKAVVAIEAVARPRRCAGAPLLPTGACPADSCQ